MTSITKAPPPPAQSQHHQHHQYHQHQHAPPHQEDLDGPMFLHSVDPDGEPVELMILESPSSAFKHLDPSTLLHPRTSRVLGTAGMVAITYLYTCGGPIGSEPVVSAGGPLVAMLALVLYPLIVTIPYAFIVAELCSAFPEDGGFTIWVLNAFGSFWGLQVGYWSWVAGIIRTALLPGVLLDLVLRAGHWTIASHWTRFGIKLGASLVLALPTFLGTIPVSRLSIVLLVVVAVPFLTFTVWAYTTARDLDDLFEIRHEHAVYDPERADVEQDGAIDVHWTVLLNTLFYKFDGIYMASVFGGEVQNPARTYPRAIVFTVLLAVATYLVPLPASIVADDLTWLDFDRDAYPTMARALGGAFLSHFILVASVAGAAGTFVAGVYLKAFMLSGMAANRLLPVALAHRGIYGRRRFDAPNRALVLTVLSAVALCGLDFDDLLPVSNAFAAVVQFLIILAAMRLRMTLPYIPRPTKVPGGIVGLVLVATVPATVLGYTLVRTFLDSWVALALTSGLVVLGIVGGLLRRAQGPTGPF